MCGKPVGNAGIAWGKPRDEHYRAVEDQPALGPGSTPTLDIRTSALWTQKKSAETWPRILRTMNTAHQEGTML